ncbi:MAG TPA: hypothetical protein VFB66_16870, partial [Tepidisphaeraceae bacterium]|nr:hypothetical protein [Tepidisphaeraceae bacterium]
MALVHAAPSQYIPGNAHPAANGPRPGVTARGFTASVARAGGVAPAALPPSSRLIAAIFAALYAFVVAAGLLVVHNPAARLARNEFHRTQGHRR